MSRTAEPGVPQEAGRDRESRSGDDGLVRQRVKGVQEPRRPHEQAEPDRDEREHLAVGSRAGADGRSGRSYRGRQEEPFGLLAGHQSGRYCDHDRGGQAMGGTHERGDRGPSPWVLEEAGHESRPLPGPSGELRG